VVAASAIGARASALGVALGLSCLAFGLIAGCGTERPPAAVDGTGQGGSSAGGSEFGGEGSTKPPGCGTKPDGAQCDCLDVPLFIDPPTIYFVLDRSGSMLTSNKWTQVRSTVGKIVRAIGPRANFGATVFPAISSADACAPGSEIMAVRAGDPPSSTADGLTTTTLLAAMQVPPSGGTPTSATLQLVRSKLDRIAGRSFVILATDGAPNCNPTASCGFDQCQPNIEDLPGCPKIGPKNCCESPDGFRENCNDSSQTLAEIASLKSAGSPVYVVGLPGAALYASLLDQMAVAGGTALSTSPKYFSVDSANEQVMLTALKKVAAQITGTCVFDLRTAPADPALVNVYMDDVVVPYEPTNGWTIDGNTVTLVGAACDRVKSGDALDVRIIAGCPRIEPR
jgi:hypothetical protein